MNKFIIISILIIFVMMYASMAGERKEAREAVNESTPVETLAGNKYIDDNGEPNAEFYEMVSYYQQNSDEVMIFEFREALDYLTRKESNVDDGYEEALREEFYENNFPDNDPYQRSF